MNNLTLCNICCENMNKTIRQPVICNYCEFICCRKCMKTHIMNGSIDPFCMNPSCKRVWTQEFVINNMSNTSYEKEYKNYRVNLILEQQKSMLPATQPLAQEKKEQINRDKIIKMLMQKKKELKNEIKKIDKEISVLIHYVEISTEKTKTFIKACPRNECRGFLSTSWKCGTCNEYACAECHEPKNSRDDPDHVCDENAKETIKFLAKDTKPCPKCSTSIYKIEGCFSPDTEICMWDRTIKLASNIEVGDKLIGDDGSVRIVKNVFNGEDDMYEIIQNGGITYKVSRFHKLSLKNMSEEVVDITVFDYLNNKEYTKSELYGYNIDGRKMKIKIKPLGVGKFYGWMIDGNHRFQLKDGTITRNCDQMYCTMCHTAFSWSKGTIETGVIHNPHFYEWQRQQNGGEAPRVAGDIPCGGNITYNNIQTVINSCRLIDKDFSVKFPLYDIHRIINHITYVEIPRYPMIMIGEDVDSDLRIDYLLGAINEDYWKMKLKTRTKKREKNREINAILNMFITVGNDLLRKLINSDEKYSDDLSGIINIINELTVLQEYTNKNLKIIGKKYNNKVPKIEENWKKIVSQ